jgi:hypothetical protein
MAGSEEEWWPFGEHRAEFKAFLAERAGTIIESAVEAVGGEVPELVGPDPRLRELLSLVISANLDNLGAAIAFKVPEGAPFESSAAIEHARLLAQRGIPATSILRGYQVIQRSLTGPVIEATQSLVEDRDELVLTIEAVLAYFFSQGDRASQAAMSTHAAARDVWMRGRGAGLSKRVDAVLDGTVTDVQTAERALNYVVSGKHVAMILWLDEAEGPLDLEKAERRVNSMRGVRDALLVPRDERTLYAWLHVTGDENIAEWMETPTDLMDARVAFGELASGIEGFRLTHTQARSAGAVIAASAHRERRAIVRFRDVAALSFLVDRPAESRGWADAVLGDLADPGEELEPLRETLRVFLEEGESAVATGQRLFVHRNTVKYRVDRAVSLLPGELGRCRLDVALALRYLDLVGAGAPRSGNLSKREGV